MYVLLFFFAFSCASALAASAQYYALENAAQYFEEFRQQYKKQYVDDHEKEHRFQIFKHNLEDANRKNKESKYTVFGITQFMDLTPKEFQRMHTGLGPRTANSRYYYDNYCYFMTDIHIPNANAPESFDWRWYNMVTPPKQQSYCNSCYAFSAVGCIESRYAMKHNVHIDLSEQQIVDCDRGSNGCQSGYSSSAYRSIIEMGGIMHEAHYPYQNSNNNCKFDKSKVVVSLHSCYTYNLTSQEKLKQLLYSDGPVVIVLRSSGLHSYTGGIVMDTSCAGGVQELDHEVLLVGYGTENNMPYWLAKNSYGPTWGENGYFKLQRGEHVNSCGIMNTQMSTVRIV